MHIQMNNNNENKSFVEVIMMTLSHANQQREQRAEIREERKLEEKENSLK